MQALGAALRGVRGKAIALLCVLIAFSQREATAQDAAVDPPPPDFLSGGRAERFLLFSGVDLWHSAVTGYGALQWAPAGLNADGPVLRLFGSDGIERYRTPAQTFTTNIGRASLLGGRHVRAGHADVTALVGLDFKSEAAGASVARFAPDTTRFGMRAAAELWIEPTPQTMLAASAYATTIDAGFGGRVAAGWRVGGAAWIGPEALISRDDFSTQRRIGAHVSGLKAADAEWSLAAGYLADSYRRSGAYGRVSVSLRR